MSTSSLDIGVGAGVERAPWRGATRAFAGAVLAALVLAGCGGSPGGGGSTNPAPTANAGTPQTVNAGATVGLNGAASTDPNGDPLTYAWTFSQRPVGSTTVLVNSGTATPTFVADVAGTYILVLVVSDGNTTSAPSAVTVTVAPSNAPVANAGLDRNVLVGTQVRLNGVGSSDVNRDALTYAWTLTTRPAGSAAALTDATTALPTFVADVAGAYVATLVVSDGGLTSQADTVTITAGASATNVAPNAHAGRTQNVLVGQTVTLDGTRSDDANGDTLTFNWSFARRPDNSASIISGNTANATFVTDVAGIYDMQLVVNDGVLSSTAQTARVTAGTGNVGPNSNAGPYQTVVAGATVTLDGSASFDANGTPLNYRWVLTSRPAGSTATLSNATDPRPTFVANVAGVYVASLIVNDGSLDSVEDSVAVIATQAGPYDGAWTGTTGQSLPVSFTVANGQIASFTFNWTAPTCGQNSTTTFNFTPALPANGGGFTFTSRSGPTRVVSGVFTSTTQMTGTLVARFDNGTCAETVRTTVTMTKP